MNEIDIDITITMGDTCSNTMSLHEAKALYTQLHKLFTDGGLIDAGSNQGMNKPANPEKYPSHRPVQDPVAEKLEPVAQGVGTDEVRMPPPNLKVEAAKQRAAKRTAGCGSRR